MKDLTPRQMTLSVHWAWVRDLCPLDARQRAAFLTALAMHYGQKAADLIRRDVEKQVAV